MSELLASDLATLMEAFEAQGWKELRVQTGDFSLLLSEDESAEVRAAAPENASPAVAGPSAQQSPSPSSTSAPSLGIRDPSWSAIVAPSLGTFYRSPKPGSAPFVEVGDPVTPGTEICLLEVMKLFTSVTAGVAGVVREIVARDAELVEGGQPLFYIEPQGS
jgi:acetyl-CoA carboxylase biotin carboxyl carrier protein